MTIPSDKTLRLERTKLTPQPPRGRNTTLIMALIAGVAASALAYVFLSQKQQAQPAQTTPAPAQVQAVIVASRDIAARQIVTPDMVQMVNVPVAKVNPNAITTLSAVEGQVTVNAIAKSNQIATTDIQPRNPNLGLSMAVPKGKRAITIALDPVSSVAGFVKPGDNVDVLCTFQAHNQSLTRTVLQNVPLLATGSQVLQTAPPPPSTNNANGNGNGNGNGDNANQENQTGPKPVEVPNATVIVTPEDAEKLILATQKGRLQLALRSTGDTSVDMIPAVHESAVTTVAPEGTAQSVKTVIKVVKVPVMPPPSGKISPIGIMPPPPSPITVIRGSSASTLSVTP